MPLINPEIVTGPVDVVPSLEEVQAREKAAILILLNKSFLNQRNDFTVLMNKFWRNASLSPEQVAEALGTDGSELFILGMLQNALLKASFLYSSGTLSPELFAYLNAADVFNKATPTVLPQFNPPQVPQPNMDGTVTLGPLPPPPVEEEPPLVGVPPEEEEPEPAEEPPAPEPEE